MYPSYGSFLSFDRREGLLREAELARRARLAPREPRRGPRVRVASLMIALAVRIAPSLGPAPHESLTIHG